jgi:UDP-N-acetyl-D-mannosaminuronate dehydrogenase
VLESATYPGTTDEEVLPILEKGALRCTVSPYTTDGVTVTASDGEEPDFYLAFSPEREDPGNNKFQTRQVPKIVGGVNASSAVAAQALYQSIFEHTYLVSSSRTAEMAKLLARFIELAGEINTAMPHHVVNHVAVALGQRGKTLPGSRVLVLGVAYEKDIDDVRESPALKIMKYSAFREPRLPTMIRSCHAWQRCGNSTLVCNPFL